jgi:uncharacterized protein YyaL (SSP411 family)
VLACLDAYETTADLSYFNFAQRIGDTMIERFYDRDEGGFFDAEPPLVGAVGALAARRKPFQDAPTPAGNSAAAVALLRLHAYTNDGGYRDKAQKTLEVFAGVADQFGIFAATYGIAAVFLSRSHTMVVVAGNDATADALYRAAATPFALNKAVLRLPDNEAAPHQLPPALKDTVPNVPGVKQGKSVAVLCADFTCRPPVGDPEVLARELASVLSGQPDRSAAD